jgi:hypothetical protein
MKDGPSNVTMKCTLCGRGGMLYMVDRKPVCPGCMKKAHPPLQYGGPERRDRQASTPWRRRNKDASIKSTR